MSLSILEQYIEAGRSHDLDLLLVGNPELISQMTSHGISPLLLACYYNKPQIVRVLLQHTKTMTIHEACAIGLTSYVETIVRQMPEIVIEYSHHGFSPLSVAAQFNKTDIVRVLLAKKADPNVINRDGSDSFPIHIAAANNNDEIVKMLIEAGANPNVIQTTGETPLHFAAQYGNIEMIVSLLESGADTRVIASNGKSPADLAFEKGYQEIGEILKN